MSDDIPVLGLAVDSRQVIDARKHLDDLSAAALRAERSAERMASKTSTAFQQSATSLKSQTTAARSATEATARLAQQQRAVGTATAATAKSSKTAATALTEQATATRRTTAATQAYAQQAQKAAAAATNMAQAQKGAVTSTRTVTGALTGQARAATGAAAATDTYAQSAASATTATSTMTRAVRGALTALATFAGLQAARGLSGLSDQATNVQNRLRQVSDGADGLASSFASVLRVANDTRSSLDSTSVLYQRLTQASADLGLTQGRILGITKTLNQAFAVSGATSAESAGAIRQLAQGLAAGALRGDEFNSVAEQGPAIMKAIRDELGLSQGALRDFAATGGITAEIVVRALENARKEIDQRFSKSTATFSQRLEIINNEYVAWAANNENLAKTMQGVGAATEAGAGALLGFFDVVLSVSAAVVELATGLDKVAGGALPSLSTALEAAAVIYVARLVPGIQAATAARLADIAATRQRMASELTAARAAQTATAAEVQRTAAVLAATKAKRAEAVATIQSAQSAQARNAAIVVTNKLSQSLTAATAAHTAAVTANTAATARATAAQSAMNVAMTAGTVAARGLASVMAFLGGPLGVALIAAYAIGTYVTSLDDAAEAADKATKENDELIASLRELNTTQLQGRADSLLSEIDGAKQALAILREELEREQARPTILNGIPKQLFYLMEQIEIGERHLAGLRKELAAVEAAYDKAFSSEQNAKALRRKKQYEDLKTATAAVVAEIKEETRVLGLSARAKALDEALTKAGTTAETVHGKAIKAANDELFDQIELLELAARKKKEDAEAAERAAKNIERAYREAFEQTSDAFYNFFRDFDGGWKGAADRAVETIKDMLARMAANIASSTVLRFLGITGTATGSGTTASASLLSTLLKSGGGSDSGGGLGDISTLASIGSKLAGGFTAAGEAVIGGLEALANLFPKGGTLYNAVGNFAEGLYELGGSILGPNATAGQNILAGGAAAAVAGVAGSFVGNAIGGQVFDRTSRGPYGATAGGVIGTAILPGIGTAIGSAIGSFLDVAFGKKNKIPRGVLQPGALSEADVNRPLDRQVNNRDVAGVTASAFGAVTFTSEKNLFPGEGSQERANEVFAALDSLSELETALAKTLSGATIASITQAVEKQALQRTKSGTGIVDFYADRFDIIFDTIGGKASELFDLTRSQLGDQGLLDNAAQVIGSLAEINNATGDYATVLDALTSDVLAAQQRYDELTASVRGFNGLALRSDELATARAELDAAMGAVQDLAVNGEVMVTTWSRVAAQLSLTNAVLGQLGATTLSVDVAGVRAADSLVGLFGGMQEMASAVAQFNGLFVDGRTATEANADAVTAVFDALELAVPTTRDAFADLVTGMDLTTQSGRDAFATLVQLSEATDAYYRNLEEADRARTDAALETLRASVDSAKEAARVRYDSDIDALRAAAEARKAANASRIASARSAAQDLSGIVSAVDRFLANAEPNNEFTRRRAQGEVQAAIASVQAGRGLGGVDLERTLSTLSKPSEDLFSTFVDYQRDYQLTNNALQQLRDSAAGQVTVQDRILATLERQNFTIDAETSRRTAEYNREIATLDAQLLAAQDAVEELRGLNVPLTDIATAVRNMAVALATESLRTGTDLPQFVAQFAAGEFDQARTADVPGFAQGGGHGGGLRLVGEQGPELEVTGPSTIASNSALRELLDSGDVVEAVQELKTSLRAAHVQLIAESMKTRKLIERWDGDGLPEERDTA